MSPRTAKKKAKRRQTRPKRLRLTDAERAVLAPPAKLSLVEWAEANRVLDPRSSARPGPWRLEATPYMRGPMMAFDSSDVQQVTVKTSTQVGKTTLIENVVGYTIDQRPRPTLCVMPRKEDAFDFSRDRLQPLFDCCPALRRRRPGMAKDLTQRVYRMPSMVFHLAWAGSPAALSSKPFGVILMDEVALYRKYASLSADPVELARERTRTFPDRKIVLTSTPLEKGDLIDVEFGRADRRFFHVPCPHCARYQILRFEQLKWTEDPGERRRLVAERDRAHELAWYECAGCGGRIDDVHKQRMLARGVWARLRPGPRAAAEPGEAEGLGETVAEGIDAEITPEALASAALRAPDGSPVAIEEFTRHTGFFLWAAYSPWLTFAEVAAQWIEAKGDREKHKVVWTLWLARAWEEEGERVEPTVIDACIDRDRLQGDVPPEAVALTAGVDLHKRLVYFVIRAWSREGSSWLVWHGALPRTGGQLSALDEVLDPVLTRLYGGAGDQRGIDLALVDARWDTETVYRYAVRRRRMVAAVMGGNSAHAPDILGKPIERLPDGKPFPRGATLYHVNRWKWNARLFDHMRVSKGDPGEWRLYGEIEGDEIYRRQVVNQEARKVSRGGREHIEWHPRRRRTALAGAGEAADGAEISDDHYFDCEAYALAAAWAPPVAIQRRTAPRPRASPSGDGAAIVRRRGFRRDY